MNCKPDDIFITYYNLNSRLRALSEDMVKMSEEIRLPEEKTVMQLTGVLKDLKKQYAKIHQTVAEELPEEEVPAYGSSIRDYEQAIEKSKERKHQELLIEAKKTLELFIIVRSSVEMYASVLASYQDEARTLLAELDVDGCEDDVLATQTAGPSAFLDALNCDDFDTEENMVMLDKVEEHYPSRISRGLAMKKYYLPQQNQDETIEYQEQPEPICEESNTDVQLEESEESRSEQRESEQEQPADEISKPDQAQDKFQIESWNNHSNNLEKITQSKTRAVFDKILDTHVRDQNTDLRGESEESESAEAYETEPEEILKEEWQDPKDDVSEKTSEEEPEQDVEVIPESEYIQALRTNGAFLGEDEAGISSIDISDAEKKKVSSTIFINDMKKGSMAAERMILRELAKNSILSKNVLKAYPIMPEEVADMTLNYLYRKGYLRKYSVMPGGSVYAPSPRLRKALTQKEASRFIGIKQEMIDIWSDSGMPVPASYIAARVAFANILAAIKVQLSGRKLKANRVSCMVNGDAFALSITMRDGEQRDIHAIGTFWTDAEACDEFLEDMQNLVQTFTNDAVLVVASVTKEKAIVNLKTILQYISTDLSGTEIYLYALRDRKYYDWETRNEVSNVMMIIENTEPGEEQEEISAELQKEALEKSNKEQMEEATEDIKILPKMAQEEKGSATESSEQKYSGQKNDKKKAEGRQEKKQKAPEKTKETTETDKEKEASSDKVEKKAESGSKTGKILLDLYSLMESGRIYAATAFAKAVEDMMPDGKRIYKLLAYAAHDPMSNCLYSTDTAYNMISSRTAVEDALIIATALRTFFSNQVQYDYNLKSFYTSIKDYDLLQKCGMLGKVVYTLMEFKDKHKKGMDAYAAYRAKDQSQLEAELNNVRTEAANFYNSYVIVKKSETAKQARFLETKKLMFSPSSDIGQYIKAIMDNDADVKPLAEDFLRTEFLRDDSDMAEDSINLAKISDYIDYFWDKAGKNVAFYRNSKLMSSLRGNVTSITTKCIHLMIKWCVLVEQAKEHKEDSGSLDYKKIENPLLKTIQEAAKEVQRIIQTESSLERRAALMILSSTLDELTRCINGTYSESERTYFYMPFLRTDDVLLDENCMPDFNMHLSTIPCLHPAQRILSHINKLGDAAEEASYHDRLHNILDEHGDDYGSAQLIVNYLKQIDNTIDYDEIEATFNQSINYAQKNANVRKADFIGELELAQSYGQIDNSKENMKEKIMQVVDDWYQWAEATSNYGFFKKVLSSYLVEIKESAKTRDKDLKEQLQVFREANIQNLTQDQKKQKIEKIRDMINAQNYTVAEDLLARAQSGEEEHETIIDEQDYLKVFLDNYDDYYRPVAAHHTKFADLVNNRMRNKEERGAKKMADSWLPGGGALGSERLMSLLRTFGFNVDMIKPQSAVAVKFENFLVKTVEPRNGGLDLYTHPIAAFGSGASQEGFRVVCINGSYDADALIDVMKQIGNTKHTLILLDHALPMSERRRLARKAKSDLGDKFFGVIDRTVMMFLFRHYDKTKIIRMLMSLIMPFGYYQPYVWESVNVMPPEIFMGRKHELEKIESPTGVNIVYGGRQLGKSALLKKAREDVDRNENGDRAVYVEIKGLDYKEAARKIGQELFDQNVLEEEIDTTDWSVLARAIKKRLQAKDKKEIPYLLLLLDEADTFIESCEQVNYKPLDTLKEVQSIGTNRFKFVIAGLRNVVRFKREAALGNNSVLTHLQSMTVKPFNTTEARELMEVPLYYLGLRFPKEKESLVSLILASTNYFPGLIQLYCAKLLEAMRKRDYAGYDEVCTPSYEISEDHIKRILADPEFMQQIREKYIITLKLDEDNYYYLIALIMAYLYHTNGYSEGYSIEDVHAAGEELGIAKVTQLDKNKLSAFMEELKELNVLRSTDDTHYLFTRFTFFQMMGTSSEVEDKLIAYMED